MPFIITIQEISTGNIIEIEVESHLKLKDVKSVAIDAFKLTTNDYILFKGFESLPVNITLGEAGIKEGDLLKLAPNPKGGGALLDMNEQEATYGARIYHLETFVKDVQSRLDNLENRLSSLRKE